MKISIFPIQYYTKSDLFRPHTSDSSLSNCEKMTYPRWRSKTSSPMARRSYRSAIPNTSSKTQDAPMKCPTLSHFSKKGTYWRLRLVSPSNRDLHNILGIHSWVSQCVTRKTSTQDAPRDCRLLRLLGPASWCKLQVPQVFARSRPREPCSQN